MSTPDPAVAAETHVDKAGYDEFYKREGAGRFMGVTTRQELIDRYQVRLRPFYRGGPPRGYVRGEAVRRLQEAVRASGRAASEVRVLDAGCGQGGLTVYLAAQGYQVIGVDVAGPAIEAANELAARVGVQDNCSFEEASLEKTSVDDLSIDYIIGVNSLHHFIKYGGVPAEFLRVMKPGAQGWFADGFGENKLFHVFHDKEKMKRLGDVILTKPLVDEFFSGFEVTLDPLDWFTMLDRLYKTVLPKKMLPAVRKLSRVHFWLDRKISPNSRTALRLSGSVVTHIRKHA